MQKIPLPEPASQRNITELRVVSINRNKNQQTTTEKDFTKLVNGDPGVNAPIKKHYPRSYNPDGPGGNYQGL